MNPRDPLVRTACRIARSLDGLGDGAPAYAAPCDIGELPHHLRMLERLGRLLAVARGRRWWLAAAVLRADLAREVRRVGEEAALLEARLGVTPSTSSSSSPSSSPSRSVDTTLRCLVDDLRELTEEFEDLRFDLKHGRIVATTDPIELNGVPLGPFAIELHLGRLEGRQRPDASCFACTALRPNPAASNASVTHPHVQDGQLCAGEASTPIAAALRQGRVCDAFRLVRSVLQTYNPASPYVPLDDWDGVACSDCDRTIGQEDTCYCEHCGRDFCHPCMSYCDACDGSCCRGCLEQAGRADADLCPACRTECGDCGRVVGRDEVDAGTGSCPQCRDGGEVGDEDRDEDHDDDADDEEHPAHRGRQEEQEDRAGNEDQREHDGIDRQAPNPEDAREPGRDTPTDPRGPAPTGEPTPPSAPPPA